MDRKEIRNARAAIEKFLTEHQGAHLLREASISAQVSITMWSTGEITLINEGLDEIMTRFLLSKGEAIYNASMDIMSKQIMADRKEVSDVKPSDFEGPANG